MCRTSRFDGSELKHIFAVYRHITKAYPLKIRHPFVRGIAFISMILMEIVSDTFGKFDAFASVTETISTRHVRSRNTEIENRHK